MMHSVAGLFRRKRLAGAAGSLLAAVAIAGAASAAPAPFAPPDPARRIALSANRWVPRTRACAALSADAGLRQRIVDVTAEEWARFRYPVEEIRERGLSVIYRPFDGRLTPRRFNRVAPGLVHRGMRMGFMEDDGAVQAAIGGYWTATPDDEGIDIQNRLRAVYRPTGWAVPWSAAFVSYVMCAAGIGDLRQFQRSKSHYDYVDQAIAAADGHAPRAIYRARDISRGLPSAGDLVCADRSGAGALRSIADRRSHPGERPMHCDVVVEVDRRSGFIALIGGNVNQSVTLTMVNIVRTRRGAPARLQTAADVAGARPYFVVLALQAFGTARLDAAPAMRRITGR